jgi:glutamate dehydrogenase
VGVARWVEEQGPAIARFRATVHRAQGAVAASPPMLAQLASQARSLLVR